MDVGISLQFLQRNSEDDTFILWMDDGTYWSYEISVKERIPFATFKKLVPRDLCVRWTERLAVKLKDDDKACSRKAWTADVFTVGKEYVQVLIHSLLPGIINLWFIKWRVCCTWYEKWHEMHVHLKNISLFLKEKSAQNERNWGPLEWINR